jgi:hypothetical protein
MGRTYVGVVALALALFVGGCGGSSKKSSSPADAPNTQQQVSDDATAKDGARTAISELEACYVDQMDYTPCAKSAAGAGITAVGTTAGYTVTATSKSGNAFVIAKAGDGSLSRTCTSAGKGGCPATGAW